MPVETPSIFTRVIEEHLELKRRNAELESQLPLGRYKVEDPFENHPLFKTEEQARLEETGEHALANARELTPESAATVLMTPDGDDLTLERPVTEPDDGLWTRSRDFDWGD